MAYLNITSKEDLTFAPFPTTARTAHNCTMDPLSITSGIIEAARLAGEVQAAFEEKRKFPGDENEQLLQIHDIVAGLQSALDHLVRQIMKADRSMISSPTLARIQAALNELMDTLKDALGLMLRHTPTEWKVSLKKLMRYRGTRAAEEIMDKLDGQRINLDSLMLLMSSEETQANMDAM